MSLDLDSAMDRALALAARGAGAVSPNPMVGAVLLGPDGETWGEGWHRQVGGPHAEVWAVRDADARGFGERLAEATLVVTLEPCSHHGRTPPCADLLVDRGVSTYEANDRRYLERSTSAHNTISVAGQEQAEIWASFRMGRRRAPKLLIDELGCVEGELHYATSAHWHRRTVRTEDDGFTVTDETDAPAQAYFHFSPELVVEQTEGGVRAGTTEVTFTGATAWKVETYDYAAGFNLLVAASRAVVRFNANLTSRITPSKSSS